MNTSTKAINQAVALLGAMAILWYSLSLIPFTKEAKWTKLHREKEEKIGDWMLSNITQGLDSILSLKLDSITHVLLDDLLIHNSSLRSKVKVHLIHSDEINAFALPGDHIVVFSGILKKMDSVDQYAGVLSHELAHLQESHILKRVSREIGISILIGMVTGSGSGGVQQIAGELSSLAFSRKEEKEADLIGAEMMIRAGINPKALGELMQKIEDLSDSNLDLEWLSSHPAGKERAEYLSAYQLPSDFKEDIKMERASWQLCQDALSENLNELGDL